MSAAALIFVLLGGPPMAHAPDALPRITTTSRLLKLGESVTFTLAVPPGMAPGDLEVFPRYLESARPGAAFQAGGDLAWLDALRSERLDVRFIGGRAEVTYTPAKVGSYLLRWRVGGEELYRYFSAVDDDTIVLRFSSFEALEVSPTLHATGIPLDYRLPAERFSADDPACTRLVDFSRRFGDSVIAALPDTPRLSHEERMALYSEMLGRARQMLADPNDARSARIDMRHALDPGYTRALAELGVNDHCGLNEANAPPWLGMPEFPYFSSPIDCRKANQAAGGDVVAHQWDFCGGWHFIGPVSWHYKAAEGDWPTAERCIRQGVEELALLTELSGHPAFAVPLYDGLVGAGYPNPAFEYSVRESRAFAGEVRQVLIADRAFTAAEVTVLMDGDVGDVSDAVVALPLGDGLRLDGEHDLLQTGQVPVVSGTDFTVACWVRPNQAQRPWANIISSHTSGGPGSYRGLSLEQDGAHTNCFYLIAGDLDQWACHNVVSQLDAETWQHFAVVREGATLTHYVNGRVSASGAVPERAFQPATDELIIGDWLRGIGGDEERMLEFIERYQRLIAFELPKDYKLVFARSIDIADYYRRHFERTPRTVYVSRTDHVRYDMWWLCRWCSEGILVPRERIPWSTRVSSIHARREVETNLKDPLSYEYILVEDHRRSIRFERECPNPIWWFDYTEQQAPGPDGSAITHTRTPDVDIRTTGWVRSERELRATLMMSTSATFAEYAIALWGLPAGFDPSRPIETDADEYILVRNNQGEYHLLLLFDLSPGRTLTVAVGAR